MDAIVIKGLRCLAKVGVSEQERLHRQELRVDIHLGVDLTGSSENLERTVDYEQVVTLVENEIGNAQFMLVETVAEKVAERLLQQPRVLQAKVRVRKFPRHLTDRLSGVAVVVSRSIVNRH